MEINLLGSALLVIGLVELIQFGIDAPLQLSRVQTEVDGLEFPFAFLWKLVRPHQPLIWALGHIVLSLNPASNPLLTNQLHHRREEVLISSQPVTTKVIDDHQFSNSGIS